MRRPFSALAWRSSQRGPRRLALASLAILLAAIALLVLEGVRSARLDLLAIAAALVLLLGLAWAGTKWNLERAA